MRRRTVLQCALAGTATLAAPSIVRAEGETTLHKNAPRCIDRPSLIPSIVAALGR